LWSESESYWRKQTKLPWRTLRDYWATAKRAANGGKSVSDAEFVYATVDDEVIFYCRMSLLPNTIEQVFTFVITFCDVTRQIDCFLLKTRTQDLRQLLSNLQLAAETVTNFTDMDQAQRHEFR
jgi:DNA polymerase-3 subunit epsilon